MDFSVELFILVFSFFFVGVFVVVLYFIKLFFSSSGGQLLKVTDLVTVDSPEFLNALAHTTDFSSGQGGNVTVIQEGDVFFDSLYKDIENAQKSVNISVYIWESGKITQRFIEILGKKAKEGVEVRLLLDGVGGFNNTRQQLSKLRENGVELRYFRGVRLDKLLQIHRRTHRRAMVIDGCLGYAGGMAFSDYWSEKESKKLGEKPWSDLMFRLTGAPVVALQTAFSELWVNASGEFLVGEKFYPSEETYNAFQEKDEKEQGYEKHNDENRPFLHLSSSPSTDVHPFSKFLWFSAASARERLYAATPYFVPNKSFHDVLKDRARSGVDVRLLVPKEKHIDRKFVKWASDSYYWDLLDAGVRIYEYKPAMMHAKLMLVDEGWSVFGSGNIDFRSFELNEENVFGMQDEALTKHLSEYFFKQLKDSQEIFLSEWKKRGVWARIREKGILLFAEQF